MSGTPRVPAGLVVVELPCPRCGLLEAIGVRLSAVLTTPDDDDATLRVRARSKPLVHDCGFDPASLFSVTHTEGADL